MTTSAYLNVLNDPDENQRMVRKLPNHLISQWCREVDKWMSESQHAQEGEVGSRNRGDYPPFSEFCRFLRKEARIACNPIMSAKATKPEGERGHRNDRDNEQGKRWGTR